MKKLLTLLVILILITGCSKMMVRTTEKQKETAARYEQATENINLFAENFGERWDTELGVILSILEANGTVKIPHDIKIAMEAMNCLTGIDLSYYDHLKITANLESCDRPEGALDDFEKGYLYGSRNYALATASYKIIRAFIEAFSPGVTKLLY